MIKVSRRQQIEYWEKEQAGRKSPDHPVIATMIEPKVNRIKEYVCLEGKNILDVGSGNGYFAYYLSKQADVVGTDISEAMLKLNPARRRVKCDASNLPFKDSSFDIVVSSNLLHHVESPARVVEEMCRVSRSSVILSDVNRNNPLLFLYSLIKKTERGALKISQNYLKAILLEKNMRIRYCSTMGFVTTYLTPVKFLAVIKSLEGFLVKILGGIYSIVISEKPEGKP